MWSPTTWPYDENAAKTITCYVRKMRVAADTPSRFAIRNVYVWRSNQTGAWRYTVEGELTGSTDTENLEEAFKQAETRSQE